MFFVYLLILSSFYMVESNITNSTIPKARFYGKAARRHQLPFMVHIFAERMMDGKTFSRKCAGTLIPPNYILTTAYCVNGKFDRIYIGFESTETGKEVYTHIKDMSRIKINADADMALLDLQKDISIDEETIKPLDLPSLQDVLINDQAYVAGWSPGQTHVQYFKSDVRNYPVPSCISNGIATISSPNKVEDSDAGGPLFISKINPKIIGIILGEDSQGVVDFIPVACFLPWIIANTEKRTKNCEA